MARSLPLGSPELTDAPLAAGAAADAEPILSGSIAVYDPAMCCPTGVCGPGVDPALIQVARDLRWLSARGATVHRYGLSQEPQAFAANARVAGLLQAFGDQALPAVLVNDAVLTHGRYPSRNELLAALQVPTDPAAGQTAHQTTSQATARQMAILGAPDTPSCESGSGCC